MPGDSAKGKASAGQSMTRARQPDRPVCNSPDMAMGKQQIWHKLEGPLWSPSQLAKTGVPALGTSWQRRLKGTTSKSPR